MRGKTRWLLTPRRLAPLLQLPADGRTSLAIGGPAADEWLARLGRRVGKPPRDATFAVHGDRVGVVPARPGVGLDPAASADALLAAALRRPPARRVAPLHVQKAQPKLSTGAPFGSATGWRLRTWWTIWARSSRPPWPITTGSTRFARNTVETDPNVNELVNAGTPVVSIFGKSWDLHTKRALGITEEENLKLISETVAYLKGI